MSQRSPFHNKKLPISSSLVRELVNTAKVYLIQLHQSSEQLKVELALAKLRLRKESMVGSKRMRLKPML